MEKYRIKFWDFETSTLMLENGDILDEKADKRYFMSINTGILYKMFMDDNGDIFVIFA